MNTNKSIFFILLFLLIFLLSSCNLFNNFFGTNPLTPGTGTIIFNNLTGIRLRGYIDDIFMGYVEINNTLPVYDNPEGRHSLKVDDFNFNNVIKSEIINLAAGQTYIWDIP